MCPDICWPFLFKQIEWDQKSPFSFPLVFHHYHKTNGNDYNFSPKKKKKNVAVLITAIFGGHWCSNHVQHPKHLKSFVFVQRWLVGWFGVFKIRLQSSYVPIFFFFGPLNIYLAKIAVNISNEMMASNVCPSLMTTPPAPSP